MFVCQLLVFISIAALHGMDLLTLASQWGTEGSNIIYIVVENRYRREGGRVKMEDRIEEGGEGRCEVGGPKGEEGGSRLADLPSWEDVYTEQALVYVCRTFITNMFACGVSYIYS